MWINVLKWRPNVLRVTKFPLTLCNKQKRVAWWFKVLITIHMCRSLCTVYRCLHREGDICIQRHKFAWPSRWCYWWQGFKVSNATTFTKGDKFTSVIESGRMALRNAARTVSPLSSACPAAAVGCSLICYVDTVHCCVAEKLFLSVK
jgi:hypothetical protein